MGNVVAQAARSGLHEHCWELTVGFSDLLGRRGYLDDISEVCDFGLAAVRAAGNRRGEAAVLETVTGELWHRHDSGTRRSKLTTALAVFDEVGDVLGAALTRRQLAFEDYSAGDTESALRRCEAALEEFVQVKNRSGQRRCLMLSGYLRIGAGDADAGDADLNRALELAEEQGDPRASAQVLQRMGQADAARSLHERAERRFLAAADLTKGINDLMGEALLREDLANVYLSLGRTDRARPMLERARFLYEQLSHSERMSKIDLLLDGLVNQA